ncbi:MAG: hypothetical protein RIE31_09250 [Alphaproteobacteria bacterium]
MVEDWLGNPISGGAPATIAAMDRFSHRLLTFDGGTGEILDAAEADPDCVLANLLAAALCILGQDSADRRDARAFLDRAAAALNPTGTSSDRTGNPAHDPARAREHRLYAALEAWQARDWAAALDRFEDLARHHPRDLVAVLLGTTLANTAGDNDRLWRLPDMALKGASDIGYTWGMLAFGLEECGRIDEADAAGRKAIALDPVDPGAHHALAHVFVSRGDMAGGACWMEDHRAGWAECSGALRTHNWWHTALFHLALDRHQRVLAIYDDHIAPRLGTAGGAQNAIGLLSRLGLRGIAVGERWQAVAAAIRQDLPAHRRPFLDLLYVHALGQARETGAMDGHVRDITRYAEASADAIRPTWHDVVLPAARALAAYGRGEWRAAAALAAMAGDLPRVGASNEERQVLLSIADDARRRISA